MKILVAEEFEKLQSVQPGPPVFLELKEIPKVEADDTLVQILDFSRDVETEQLQRQNTEPDIERSRRLVTWSDHLVFIYPTWWGTMPSLIKGFVDRLLLPGRLPKHAFERAHAHGRSARYSCRTPQTVIADTTPTSRI